MDGEGEVLSFGSPEPSRVPRLLVVAGVLAALVGGYLVWDGGEEEPPAAADRPVPERTDLVAGTVREGADSGVRLSFEVVLHNSGAVPVVVYLDRIGPVDVQREVTRGPVRVAAGSTVLVDVVAPTACDHDGDVPFTTVAADVDEGDGRRPATIPLLDATDLLDYLDSVCRPATTDLPASALEGVWSMEQVYGRQGTDEQPLVWFRADGTFAISDEGRVFTRGAGWRGSFAVRDGRLLMVAGAGDRCEPGQDVVWQVHRRTTRLLDLRLLEGGCPFEPGGMWTLRRVLAGVPAGVDW